MSGKSRKTPMRMCLGCREMKPKQELIRIVTPKDGEMHMDLTGREGGRGAYLCRNISCLDALQKHKGNRLPEAVANSLREQIEG